MATVHTVMFGGKAIETTVTNCSTTVDVWLHNFSRGSVFGLDIRGPWYSRTTTITTTLRYQTLILCCDDKCLIFQENIKSCYFPSTELLKSLCADETNRFVGIDIEDKVGVLSRKGLLITNYSEVSKLWKGVLMWRRKRSPNDDHNDETRDLLVQLMDFYCKNKHKSAGKSRGSDVFEDLSMDVIEDATIDAHISYIIGSKLFFNPVP